MNGENINMMGQGGPPYALERQLGMRNQQPASASLWEQVIDEHDMLAKSLHCWIDELQAKLSPVLRDLPPQADPGKRPTGRIVRGESALLRKCDALRQEYGEIAMRLGELLSRVEL